MERQRADDDIERAIGQGDSPRIVEREGDIGQIGQEAPGARPRDSGEASLAVQSSGRAL